MEALPSLRARPSPPTALPFWAGWLGPQAPVGTQDRHGSARAASLGAEAHILGGGSPVAWRRGGGAGGCRVLLESRRKKGARRQSLDRGATGRGGRERPVTGGVRAEVSASLAGRGDLGGGPSRQGEGDRRSPPRGWGLCRWSSAGVSKSGCRRSCCRDNNTS